MMHPVILSGKHPLTKLIIQAEHLRLLHAGSTLLTSSLNHRYHIFGGRRVVRSITRSCVICQCKSQKQKPQMMGQLPTERVTPDIVFENVGVDYAGPIYIKYGHVRKPTVVKAYICVFVSLSVKAAHLELVSDLTSEAFISTFRRFIARRGKPSLVWSDHGSNFVGAQKDLKQLAEFLEDQKTQNAISQFCASQKIVWKFIPERSPHFGGLWESCVKSMKYHLKRVLSGVKLTFEEYTTVLTQVEACLNSRPLVALSCDDDGCDEVESSTLKLSGWLFSLFDNLARRGGALHFEKKASNCFLQKLSLYWSPYAIENIMHANTVFANNSAHITGDSLYGGTFDRRSINTVVEPYASGMAETHRISYLLNTTNTDLWSTSSCPMRVCF